MKLKHGGTGAGVGWTQVFGVNPGPADPGEPEVETLDPTRLDDRARAELGLRRGGIEFLQGLVPVGVEVAGAGITALVDPKFREGFVDQWHASMEDRVRRNKKAGLSASPKTGVRTPSFLSGPWRQPIRVWEAVPTLGLGSVRFSRRHL